MFLKPTLSFTIPSVHDGHKLDCRIFHPPALLTPPSSQSEDVDASGAPPWGRHIAIGSQTYEPLQLLRSNDYNGCSWEMLTRT